MIVAHKLPAELLTRPVRIMVVGCGGNGSEIASGLPHLHHALLAFGHPGGLEVRLVDGDVVSETNTVRQAFSRGDIGHSKAAILVNRINAFYGLRWGALSKHLTVDSSQRLGTDIVIGCVDSRRGRGAIWGRLNGDQRSKYWLDLGNDASSGQFILGQPIRDGDTGEYMAHDRLPTVAELYPETIDASADKGDTLPSCSAQEALQRQEPFVNRTLAAHALAMLARLFRYGELAHHGGFVNLVTGRVAPIPVSPEHWARTMAANESKAKSQKSQPAAPTRRRRTA